MPAFEYKIRSKEISVLRDTGIDAVLVRRESVDEDKLIGTKKPVHLVNRTVKTLPEANSYAKTTFCEGALKTLCMKESLYDLIFGNVLGSRD
ncbi:hypothetical protein HPB47_027594 [Ixodes persulcatus]|uniref:Uncharacterized protein n=1 Tax=Ixodes persulcatus TaxID=34615 RepID=A0AC60PWU7_IXOPE|nr:hypothetical protein HPB47_027594 [Ixodes persulcatus]